jgi:putative hydrolases of HD superfamily
MQNINLENLIDFFYEVGTLRRIMCSYHINLLTDTESVAEHSHRAMIIAYTLAKLIGNVDQSKVLMMAAFHDMPETRTSDSNWIQKQYMNQDEEKALDAQLELMEGLGDEIKLLLDEYHKRETLESKIAKDADSIEYYISLRELEMQGNQEAKRRLDKEKMFSTLYTKEAKELAEKVFEVHPTEWTRRDLERTRKKYQVKGTEKP